jgi:hypothetical protein
MGDLTSLRDGLYILLKPQSKNKRADQPKVPSHLNDLVMPHIPPETW